MRITSDVAVRAAHAAGTHGVTVKELCTEWNQHHGQVSGALSNAHKAGRLVRLAQKRQGASVYVTPPFHDNRRSVPHASTNKAVEQAVSTAGPAPEDYHALVNVREAARNWLARDADGWSPAGRDPKGFIKAMREVVETP